MYRSPPISLIEFVIVFFSVILVLFFPMRVCRLHQDLSWSSPLWPPSWSPDVVILETGYDAATGGIVMKQSLTFDITFLRSIIGTPILYTGAILSSPVQGLDVPLLWSYAIHPRTTSSTSET